MNSININLDFIIKHLPNSGLDLATRAYQYQPEILDGLFDCGWHKAIIENNLEHARTFLSILRFSNDVSLASKTLDKFLDGASSKLVNDLLMKTAKGNADGPAALHWFYPTIYNKEKKDLNLAERLYQTALKHGLSLEEKFNFSTANSLSGKKQSIESTLSSALIYISISKTYNTKLAFEFSKDKVSLLMNLGKLFDKQTAIYLANQSNLDEASKWVDFFIKKDLGNSEKFIKFTSRSKFSPDIFALIQSNAAKYSIEKTIRNKKFSSGISLLK